MRMLAPYIFGMLLAAFVALMVGQYVGQALDSDAHLITKNTISARTTP